MFRLSEVWMSSIVPSFGADESPDRRIAPRFQPAYGTVCQIDQEEGPGSASVGLVWNISKTGVCMLLGSPPKSDAELAGRLSTEAGDHMLPVVLRVVHIRPIQTGDYFVGAQFARPLKTEEIEAFLIPQTRTRGSQ